MVRKNRHPFKTLLIYCVLAVLTTACDTSTDSSPDFVELSTDQSVTPGLRLSVPQRLRSIQQINPADIRATVTINGFVTELQQNVAGEFFGQIQVPAESTLPVSVEFFETFAGQRLNLASINQSVGTGAENSSITLRQQDYDFDSFDNDGDNVNNLLEREFNTDPFDNADVPDLINLEVTAIRPALAVNNGFSNYRTEVVAGTQVRSMNGADGDFSQSFTVVRQTPLQVEVRLIETQTGQQLTVGSQVQVLTDAQAQETVFFAADAYNLQFDQDDDGSLNLTELVAGTDVFAPPAGGLVPIIITFDVPEAIADPAATFATLMLDGQNIDLSRSQNTYMATAFAVAGSDASVSVLISDTVQGQVLTLADFDNVLQPVSGQTFALQNFSLEHDDDSDGIQNYLELQQGSDPFSAPTPPVPEQCTPVTEVIELASSDDAFIINNSGVIFDTQSLQVDFDSRTGLIRYQYDDTESSVISAALTLGVGADGGVGVIAVNSIPGFDWSDTDNRLSLPPPGPVLSELDSDWTPGSVHTFDLDPAIIVSDFTLVLQQLTDSNDVGFNSSTGSIPPRLELTVSRCV